MGNRILSFRSGLEFYSFTASVGDGSSLFLYLSFGWSLRCAGRRCSIIIYVLIYFGGIIIYFPFVLLCVAGHLFNENYGCVIFSFTHGDGTDLFCRNCGTKLTF